MATLNPAALVAPQAAAGSPPGYEQPFWQRAGALWRQLAGSFSREGFSFEWHELQPLRPTANGTIAILLQPVATGMAAPDYAISPPGDIIRLFVVEQYGLLRISQTRLFILRPGNRGEPFSSNLRARGAS